MEDDGEGRPRSSGPRLGRDALDDEAANGSFQAHEGEADMDLEPQQPIKVMTRPMLIDGRCGRVVEHSCRGASTTTAKHDKYEPPRPSEVCRRPDCGVCVSRSTVKAAVRARTQNDRGA